MDGETKRGHPTRQSDRPHAWKGGGIDRLPLETVSLTTANMCQGNRGEASRNHGGGASPTGVKLPSCCRNTQNSKVENRTFFRNVWTPSRRCLSAIKKGCVRRMESARCLHGDLGAKISLRFRRVEGLRRNPFTPERMMRMVLLVTSWSAPVCR